MSLSKRTISLDADEYCLDRDAVLDLVGLPAGILYAFIESGHFPAPVHGDWWFAPDVYRWLNESQEPPETHGDADEDDLRDNLPF